MREPGIKFDEALIRRYGGRGPRYTSYPTAAQFREGFSVAEYLAQVDASNAGGRPLSVYVHIPYCRSLCYYCACNKVITQHPERAARYLDQLGCEIALQGALFDRARRVEQLHLGGGTPTYLSNAQLERLMGMLDQHFGLQLDGGQEFSIEIDPRTVDPERLVALGRLGFNRLSMGVQDFDPAVQLAVNRVQSARDTLELIAAAPGAGFRSVSVDLIYGLPAQSVASFDRTLDLVLEARPDRVALYSYAHLPARVKAQRLIDEAAMPAPEVKLALLEHSITRITAAGYVYVGMDHFAAPEDELVRAHDDGSLQRNFQGYSTHAACDLIGLGASAIGSIADCYAQNAHSDLEYGDAVAAGELAVRRGVRLDGDDRLRRDVIQAIMCHGELDTASIARQHDIVFEHYFARELQMLDTLADDGLVELDGARVLVTPRGQLVLRAIAMVFDRYLQREQRSERFSRVI